MMQSANMATWFQCLHKLSPPNGLIHIGAGGGLAQRYPFATMPRLLLIDAQGEQVARLKEQLQEHRHCKIVQATMAGTAANAKFYAMSVTGESGLFSPIELQKLWPNIKTLHCDQVATTTLELLLAANPDAREYNWAMIDCLPAGMLLHGAGTIPEKWDVLLVRALKGSPHGGEAEGASLGAITQQLANLGLDLVAQEEENHPQVVRALFVRSLTEKVSKLNAVLERKTQAFALQIAEREAVKTEALTQRDAEASAKVQALAERDAHANRGNELQAALDAQAEATSKAQEEQSNQALAHAKQVQEATQTIVNLQTEKAQISSARDAEAQAKAEVLTQRDAHATRISELQAALDAQAQAAGKAQEEQSNQALAQTKQAQEATRIIAILQAEKIQLQADITALVRQHEQSVNTYQKQHSESQAHQQMLMDEITRAEAQIDLIKDLLLREPSL